MDGYQPADTFADRQSALDHDERGDEREAVERLAALAGSDPVLELAIGTGRLALPLAARGVSVDGVDFSPVMLDRLREKPGSDRLSVWQGDMADLDAPRRYGLIFVAWNSLFNLLTQQAQVQCFEGVARHLLPGGRFLVEAFTPGRFYREAGLELRGVSTKGIHIGALTHDPSVQRIEQTHVWIEAGETRVRPVVQRYAWPSELDLMAQHCGLELESREGGWIGEPFTADSQSHVSVYRS